MGTYPKRVNANDVVNTDFAPGLFKLEGGRTVYDEVWMADGGSAVYLGRIDVTPDGLKVVRRWIPWNAPILQMYDPLQEYK